MEILKHEGKPAFVVMPFSEYEAMQRLLEELQDQKAYREAKTAIAKGDEELIPEEVVQRLLTESPVKVWREYRGLKQKELSVRSGVSTSLLSQIESGKKKGSVDTIKALAQALGLDIEDIS